jgi:outer membrane lipase/esterase
MTYRKIAAYAAGVSIAALALAAPAMAQQFGRTVTFGDSLSDNGNLFIISGGTAPPGGGLPLYPSRRFSSGLTFAEILSGPMLNFPLATPATVNAGNVNYAVGGSRTTGPMTPGPTTEQQIGLFLGSGGRFGGSDLVTYWAGANNLFQSITAAAATPATAQAAVGAAAAGAATDVGNQVRALAAAGARTIVVVNLPNFSSLPAYNFGAGAAANQLAGFGSATFNSAWSAALAQAAAASPGANVVSVDSSALFAAVIANPAAFGYTNVTDACVRTPACATLPAAQQNSFLFYDDVHPTEQGYRYIAASVQQHLQAPSRAASIATAFGETALALRRSGAIEALANLGDAVIPGELTTAAIVRKGDPAPPVQPSPWRFFVSGTGDYGRSDARFANGLGLAAGVTNGNAYEYKTGGVRFGGVRDIGAGWSVGGVFHVTGGDIDGGRVPFSANVVQFGGDIVARWVSAQGFFVNGAIGFNVGRVSDYEYRTVGPLQNTGSTITLSGSVIAEAGYDFRWGALTLTPVGRLGYIRSTVDSFNEAGIVAPVAYGSRSTDVGLGGFELRATYQIGPQTKVGAFIGYEDYFGSSVSGIGRIINNTAQSFSIAGRDPIGQGVIFGGNAEMAFGAWTAKVSYKGSVGDNSTIRHAGTIGASFRF